MCQYLSAVVQVFLQQRLSEPIVEHIVIGVHPEVAQTTPQERIVVDAPMPQAVENVDIAIDLAVPQILKECGQRAVPHTQTSARAIATAIRTWRNHQRSCR